jgi:hypothetical protein
MNRTTRQALPVAVAVAMAALVVGTGIASAQAEPAASVQAEPAAAASAVTGHGTSAVAGHGTSAATGSGAAAPVEPLLAACEDSELPPHTVATPFGEVGAAEDNPQLLITEAPDEVTVGRPFTIKVSTRNLVRDRFLPAAQGGYYVEPSTLNEDGLVRGHFHTACRVLGNIDQAPEPERQAVFVATEDGGGGTAPDTVTVKIPGLPAAGEIQCAAGRMMQFANQIPAFDAVRITVTGKGKGKGKGSTPANAGRPADTGGRADATPRVDDNQGSTTGKGTDAGGRSTPGKATDAGGRSTPGKATDAGGRSTPGKATDAGGRSTPGKATDAGKGTDAGGRSTSGQ